MKKALLIFLTLCSSLSFGQSWYWARQAKSLRPNSAGVGSYDHSIAVDDAGNSYVAGYFEGSLSFGPYTLTDTINDAEYLVKYDASGNVLWARQANQNGSLNSPLPSVAVDRNDNVYISGYFAVGIIFGNDTLNENYYQSDMFIAKYDANGNVLWAKQAINLNNTSESYGQSVAVDIFDNAYVTGPFSGFIAFDGDTLRDTKPWSPWSEVGDVFLVKYDPSGNVLWARQSINPSGTSCGSSGSVAVDKNGSAYITGCLQDTLSFGSFTLKAKGGPNANLFLVKYDVSGNVMWANQANITSSDYGLEGISTAVDGAGGIYVTGSFYDTVIFNSDTLKETILSGDVFLAKYNTSGGLIWAKQAYILDSNAYFGCTVVCDTLKNGGGYILIGNNGGGSPPYKLKFDPDTFNLNIAHAPNGSSVCLHFDSAGNALCGMMFNGSFDIFESIGVDRAGRYTYLAGDIDTTTVFGPDTLKMWGTNQLLPFVAKWETCCPNIVTKINSSSAICDNHNGTATIITSGDTSALAYIWSPTGGINATATGLSAGTYSVTITDAMGCKANNSVVVKDSLGEIFVTACCNSTINSGNPIGLTVTPANTYNWSPAAGLSCTNCQSPIATPTVTTKYYVTVTDSAGCSATDSVLITVNESVNCGSLFVPDAFSPNGDGQNDILYVHDNCINTMDFVIFDRWGNKVFETESINNGWDGTYKGEPMNIGTYVYYLTATLNDGTTVNKKGNVALVR